MSSQESNSDWSQPEVQAAPPDTEQIQRLASVFRTAIMQCPRSDLFSFRNFPRGSCGDTSILLGQYLYEQGQGIWTYASGERVSDDFQSHAWLEKDGLIVDITADQFDDIDEPVIVTHDGSWHKQFELPEPQNPALISSYDERTQRLLSAIYTRIQAVLQASDAG